MGESSKREIHPIGEMALACFTKGWNVPDPAKWSALEASFRALVTTPELLPAAVTLIQLARFLRKTAPESSRKIFALTKVALPHLEKKGREASRSTTRALRLIGGGSRSAVTAPAPLGRGATSLLAVRAKTK